MSARFHQFMRDTARALGVDDPVNSSAAKLVGAKLVGRWPSGAPVEREPARENADLADVDCNNNNFEFNEEGDAIPAEDPNTDPFACSDTQFPPSPSRFERIGLPFYRPHSQGVSSR